MANNKHHVPFATDERVNEKVNPNITYNENDVEVEVNVNANPILIVHNLNTPIR